MAAPMSNTLPKGNMHLLHNPGNMLNGSPKMAPQPLKTNIKKIANNTRTGDVVSDDSDSGDEADSSTAEDDDGDDDSEDEADVFALPGVGRIGNIAATSRLAGLARPDGDQAVAGAAGTASDEDDYDAVEDISDDESQDENETSLLKSAEKDLIEEYEQTEKPRTAVSMSDDMHGLTLAEDSALARRLSLQSEDSGLEELDFSQDPFAGLPTNDSLYLEMIEDAEGVFDNDLASWRIPDSIVAREHTDFSNGNEKRVRFAETATSSRSSSLSSEDDPRDAYPDLFDGADDHMLSSQMMMDIDNAVEDDNESVYDYENLDQFEKTAFDAIIGTDAEDEDERVEMSDDSDSDDGETTDEEGEEEQMARLRAIQQRSARTSATMKPPPTPPVFNALPQTPVRGGKRPSAARVSASGRSAASSKGEGRPKTGTFTHDPSRAAVTSDGKGSGVKLVCPSKPSEEERAYWERARRAMGSRDGSPGESVTWTRTTPRAAGIPQRPFTAKSTLGTMFDGNLDFLANNDEIGISKEFLMPAKNHSVRSAFAAPANVPDEANAPFASSNVNLEDFVQISDSDSDMADVPSAPLTSPITESFSLFTNDESPITRLDNADLLDHFDQQPGLVSSFRNNQTHARHASSLAAHPASRAQTSEANALQKGRRAAANVPITPARKKRGSQDLDITGAGIRKAPVSPLAQRRRRSRGNSLSQTLALEQSIRFPKRN